MIYHSLSEFVVRAAPLAANHLWQSTLFALLAAVARARTRKDQARIRFAIWLVASLKFLVPFSLLVALGTHFARPHMLAPTSLSHQSSIRPCSKSASPSPLPRPAPHRRARIQQPVRDTSSNPLHRVAQSDSPPSSFAGPYAGGASLLQPA